MKKCENCELLIRRLIRIRKQIDFIISRPYSNSISSGNRGRGNKGKGVKITQLIKRRETKMLGLNLNETKQNNGGD